jgi:hypothetical protein
MLIQDQDDIVHLDGSKINNAPSECKVVGVENITYTFNPEVELNVEGTNNDEELVATIKEVGQTNPKMREMSEGLLSGVILLGNGEERVKKLVDEAGSKVEGDERKE